MIKAILIDDESHCLETLQILLQEYCPEVMIIEKCRSAPDCIEIIKKKKPDLLFLDIHMPAMNGFELLEHLADVSFDIVFTTSFDQYALKAIRFSALDYLMKPITPSELVHAVKKVKERQQPPMAEQFEMLLKQIRHKEHGFTKIAVPTALGYELIPADEVIYCQADDNYTHLFLKKKNKITACRTLKEVEEQLHEFPFFIRVHHSFIVNLNEVTKYVKGEGGHLIMSDSSTVNVSRSRKDALLKFF